VSLEEQLSAQYKLAKATHSSGRWTIAEPGTVLEIKKSGILGVPPTTMAICPSKFENDDLKGPGVMCKSMVGPQNLRDLTVGEKVYPAKMEVNLKKDKITIAIVECDSCNGEKQLSSYRSEVVFQFAKGYLGTATAGQVEDIIGKVLSVSTDEGQQNNTAQNADSSEQEADQQPDPQTIHLGQSIEQVLNALGKPNKIVDLGSKQIYVYNDIKVTFVSGKVSDVQ